MSEQQTQTLNLPQKGVKSENGKLVFETYAYGQAYYTPVVSSGFFQHYEALNIREVEQLTNFVGDLKFKGLIPSDKYLRDFSPRLTEEQVNSVKLVNWPKFDADEFLRIIKFYHLYCLGIGNRSALEAGTIFYHHQDHGLKAMIPTQTVKGGHWDWDLIEEKTVNGVKQVTELPIAFLDPSITNNKTVTKSWLDANGWVLVGTSHSHNTLTCTWSGSKRKTVTNFSSDDYASQAGSLEKPKPPLLHLLVRSFSFSNHSDLTKFPKFQINAAVNINGDLIAVSTDEVIADVSNDDVIASLTGNAEFDTYYANLNWCGEELAKSLATVPVYKPGQTYTYGYPRNPVQQKALPAYSNYWQGGYGNNQYWSTPNYYQNQNRHNLVVEGEAAQNVYANKSVWETAEMDYLKGLILDLFDLLSLDDQVDVLDRQIDSWLTDPDYAAIPQCSDIGSIMQMLIDESENIQEGVADLLVTFVGEDAVYQSEVEVDA
jgi:hypothetical protein